MTSMRAHIASKEEENKEEPSVIIEKLIQLRKHYDTLVGYISNMSFIADNMSPDQTLYAMNTSQLFLYAIDLHEKAQDSLKIFEQREAIAQFGAALTIFEELLYEIRLSAMLNNNGGQEEEGAAVVSGSAENTEELKKSPNQQQAPSSTPTNLVEAYTFTATSNNSAGKQHNVPNQCRFFSFDESSSVTVVTEATLLTLAAETEKNLNQLKDDGSAAGIANSASADGNAATV